MIRSGIRHLVVNRLGINRAVTFIYLNIMMTALQGLISVYFIVTRLTSHQQGIWYTFTSLAAFAVLADLGFTNMISQYVSHIYAKLRYENGLIAGDGNKIDELFSLIRYSIRLFSLVIIAAVLLLIIAGSVFFGSETWQVMAAFSLFSLVGGVNLFVVLMQSIYQGFDKVAEIQTVLFKGTVVTTIAILFLLMLGLNIWSLAISKGLGVAVMIFLLYKEAKYFWRQFLVHKIAGSYSWFRVIVPVQGKYALSFVSSFLIFNLYVPVIYKSVGSVMAGKFGLSYTIVMAMYTFSIAWVTSRVPTFNILVANNQRKELGRLLRKSLVLTISFYLLGSIIILALLCLINHYHLYEKRFLSVSLTALILLSQLQTAIFHPLIIYLRAHKDDPWFVVALIYGALTGMAIFIILPLYGLKWLLVGINSINWFVAAPCGALLFFHYRRKYEQGYAAEKQRSV